MCINELSDQAGQGSISQNLERIQKSMESLKQIHQQEVERMKGTNQAEMSKLKQQIDAKENEVIRLELVLQKEQEARRQAEETAGRVGVFDNRLDISQIERESGPNINP